jgi:glycosyltransferase involved in cell wall biosynthesis
MTLYHFPMLPVENRYPLEWWKQFENEYEKAGIDYEYVIPRQEWPIPFPKGGDGGTFSPLVFSSMWELQQAEHFLEKFLLTLEDDDTIFFTDIDFPGFSLPLAHMIRLQKPRVTIAGYLHAGSYCNRDLFASVPGKLQAEISMMNTYDIIFVGSHYHQDKLYEATGISGGEHVYVVPPPLYQEQFNNVKVKPYSERKYDVVFASRMDSQKKGDLMLYLAEKNPDIQFAVTAETNTAFVSENIHHIPSKNRAEYYEALSEAVVFLSTAEEETFGYSMVEAMSFGLIPVVPNRLSYPELTRRIGGKKFLYSTEGEAKQMLREALLYAETLEKPEKYNLDFLEHSIEKMLKIMLGEPK